MRVSVIVPAYNRRGHLINTLASLVNQDFPHDQYEIIVVDDGSKPSLENLVLAWRKKNADIHYHRIEPSERDGRGSARNKGIQAARNEILLFIDSDMICEPDLIRRHHACFLQKGNKEIVVIGSRVLLWDTDFRRITPCTVMNNMGAIRRLPAEKDDREESFYRFFKGENLKTQVVWEILYSNNFSIHSRTLKKAGGFDRQFQQRWGLEDTDLGYRLHQRGVEFIHARQAVAYHQAHDINMRNNYQDLTENMKLFYKKHEEWRVELYTFYPVITKGLFFKTVFRLERALRKEKPVHAGISKAAARFIQSRPGRAPVLLISGHSGLIEIIRPDTVLEIHEANLADLMKKHPRTRFKPLMGLRTPYTGHAFETVVIHTQRLRNYDADMLLRLLWEAGRIGKKIVILSLEGRAGDYRRIADIVKNNIRGGCCQESAGSRVVMLEIDTSGFPDPFDMAHKIKVNLFTDFKTNLPFQYYGIELAAAMAKDPDYLVSLTPVCSLVDNDVYSMEQVMTAEHKLAWREMKKHPTRYFWDETHHLTFIYYALKDELPACNIHKAIPIARTGSDTVLMNGEVDFYNQHEMVWCLSEFCRDLLVRNGVDHRKLFVAPMGVNPRMFHPAIRPRYEKNKFTFLFAGLPVYNKGFEQIVEAYTQAFSRDDQVRLILKFPKLSPFNKMREYYTPETQQAFLADRQEFVKKMQRRIIALRYQMKMNPRWPEMIVLEEDVPLKDFGKYYTSCDCFLYPYYEEDIGFEIMQAMACGSVPMVTGQYGPSEICSQDNSLAVKFKTVPLYFDELGYADRNYTTCTEPDSKDLKEKMRNAFANRARIGKKGLSAVRRIEHERTIDLCAEKIKAGFQLLEERKQEKMSHPYQEYCFYKKNKMINP